MCEPIRRKKLIGSMVGNTEQNEFHLRDTYYQGESDSKREMLAEGGKPSQTPDTQKRIRRGCWDSSVGCLLCKPRGRVQGLRTQLWGGGVRRTPEAHSPASLKDLELQVQLKNLSKNRGGVRCHGIHL